MIICMYPTYYFCSLNARPDITLFTSLVQYVNLVQGMEWSVDADSYNLVISRPWRSYPSIRVTVSASRSSLHSWLPPLVIIWKLSWCESDEGTWIQSRERERCRYDKLLNTQHRNFLNLVKSYFSKKANLLFLNSWNCDDEIYHASPVNWEGRLMNKWFYHLWGNYQCFVD